MRRHSDSCMRAISRIYSYLDGEVRAVRRVRIRLPPALVPRAVSGPTSSSSGSWASSRAGAGRCSAGGFGAHPPFRPGTHRPLTEPGSGRGVLESVRLRVGASATGPFRHADYPLRATLEYRGDAGVCGPDSASWPLIGDVSAFVGGIRALLIQSCHPEAAAGVADHSQYREDPLGRLSRTSSTSPPPPSAPFPKWNGRWGGCGRPTPPWWGDPTAACPTRPGTPLWPPGCTTS